MMQLFFLNPQHQIKIRNKYNKLNVGNLPYSKLTQTRH